MSILGKLRTRYGENVGVELFFLFPDLKDDQLTFLDADTASGVTSLSADGVNFATSQYIVIGQPGNVKTEIIQIHTSTSPTSTTITLASATSFAHNRGDLIRFIPYNQITAERSTDSGSTYSTLTAVNIRSDSSETYLQRTGDASTDYYRFRFYNSSSGLYSAYSDAVIASGFAANTIWDIKNRALGQLGEKRGDLITDSFLNDCIQEARRVCDMNPAIFRWRFRKKFGQTVGTILAGAYSIAVPTDLRDPNTNKNILSLRFGDQNRPCIYQPMDKFNQNFLNVVHTTTSGATSSGATTLVLTSTKNLPSSGTLTVANNTASTSGLLTVTWTGNTKSTNTLTGCTGITRTISASTDVWYKATFGLPTAYTVYAGKIYFDLPVGAAYDSMDVLMDYYGTIPSITTDNQVFDEDFYDLYVPYLKFKIKSLKVNGKIDRDDDSDYRDWMTGLASLIGQQVSDQRISFVPDVEGFLSAVE